MKNTASQLKISSEKDGKNETPTRTRINSKRNIFKFLNIFKLLLLVRLLFRKKLLFPIILLSAIIYFVPSYVVSFYISMITGTDVKADFSLSSLFLGNVKFNSLTIYSPKRFGSSPALQLENLKIDINVTDLFQFKTVINSIKADEVDIVSIYADSSNNIKDIVQNMNSFFGAKEEEKSSDYLIKEVLFRNIYIQTYYYSKNAISSKINDIYLKDISSKNNISETLMSILDTCIINKVSQNDSNNIGLWDRTVQGIKVCITVTINGIGTGLNVANDTLSTIDQVKRTVDKVKKYIKRLK